LERVQKKANKLIPELSKKHTVTVSGFKSALPYGQHRGDTMELLFKIQKVYTIYGTCYSL